jgi:hypothetical protein
MVGGNTTGGAGLSRSSDVVQLVMDKLGRALSLLAVSIAVLFAVRDMLGRDPTGFPSASAVVGLHYAFYDHLWGAVRLLVLSVAATLVWWAPQRSQARILAGALIGLSLNNNYWFYAADNPLLWPSVALNYLGIAFGLMQLLRFAASYGEGEWMHIRGISKAIAPYVGVYMAILGTLWWTTVLVWQSPNFTLNDRFWYSWDAINVLVITMSLIVVANAKAEDRTRTLWVAASFFIGALGTAIHGATRAVEGDTAWVNTLDSLAQAAMALGLWYAVLWQRAFDLNFVVNRLVAFTIVSVFLSVLIESATALSESVSGSATFGYRGVLGTGFTLGSTMVVVASFRIIENYTDKCLGRLRGRSSDDGNREGALFAFARDILGSKNPQVITEKLLETLEVFGGVRGAAIYWRNGPSSFNCIASHLTSAPAVVPSDDSDVVGLARSNQPRRITSRQRLPLSWAFPMLGRGAFRGFVLCDVGDATIDRQRADAIQVAVAAAATAMSEATT